MGFSISITTDFALLHIKSILKVALEGEPVAC